MSTRNLFKPTLKYLDSRSHFSSQNSYQKSIQVCLLGANTRLGSYASYLMKQNPLISTLHLQGCFPLDNTAVDLNFIDTKCRVRTYCGTEKSVTKAVKSADVVVFLPIESCKPDATLGERIMAEGKRLYNMALQCSTYAPRAIMLVCVPPVSVTTSIVAEVFKKTNFYHPGRIIGSAAVVQVRANTLLGRHQGLDPSTCYVPLVGGPEVDIAVPLFSRAKPVEVFGNHGCRVLTAKFRGVKEDQFPKDSGNPHYIEACVLPEAYALNQLITSIALGICGDDRALANVYMRSKILDTCKYLVSSVKFSRGGAVHNFGIPDLSRFELDLVEKAALELKEREKMAFDYLGYIESKEKKPKLPSFMEKEKEAQELLKKDVIK